MPDHTIPETVTLSVPGMSCGHCRASITTALTALGASVAFDQPQRRVTVTGADRDAATAALARIGFPAQVVA